MTRIADVDLAAMQRGLGADWLRVKRAPSRHDDLVDDPLLAAAGAEVVRRRGRALMLFTGISSLSQAAVLVIGEATTPTVRAALVAAVLAITFSLLAAWWRNTRVLGALVAAADDDRLRVLVADHRRPLDLGGDHP